MPRAPRRAELRLVMTARVLSTPGDQSVFEITTARIIHGRPTSSTIMDIYRTDCHKCLPDAVLCPVPVAISMFLVVPPYHVTLSLVHVAVFAMRRSVVGIPVCYGPT